MTIELAPSVFGPELHASGVQVWAVTYCGAFSTPRTEVQPPTSSQAASLEWPAPVGADLCPVPSWQVREKEGQF